MEKDLYEQDGRWWKFERYRIAEGYIVPTAGAALLRYDPWELYVDAVQRRRTVWPPYQTLMELVCRIEFSAGRLPRQLTPGSEQSVLQWVHRWGLLGILPGICEVITLPPKEVGGERSHYVRYVRRSGVWSQTGGRTLTDPVRPGAVVWRSAEHNFIDQPLEPSYGRIFQG